MRWKSKAWRDHILKHNALKRKYPREHGYKSRLYTIWKCMRFRCYQTSHEAYKRYSVRGIVVCPEWKNDFMEFRGWSLVNGYSPSLTLDRIDNSGNYSPSNCHWVSVKEQARNRTDNIPPILAFGEVKPLFLWAEDPRCVVTYRLLWRRINSCWPSEKAIITPSQKPS